MKSLTRGLCHCGGALYQRSEETNEQYACVYCGQLVFDFEPEGESNG